MSQGRSTESSANTVQGAVQPQENQQARKAEEEAASSDVSAVMQITITLPHTDSKPLSIQVGGSETVNDIRQCITDVPSTAIYTAFHFEHEGKVLDDLTEVGSLSLRDQSELVLVEDPYNERDARIHLARMVDLLSGNKDVGPGGKTLYDCLRHDSTAVPLLSARVAEPTTKLSEMHVSVPKCLRSISLSGWNPAPAQRRLRGDLFYILVETLEGDLFHISATNAGFHLNGSGSTTFDPLPTSETHHSLVRLLRSLSANFRANFEHLLTYMGSREPLLTTPLVTARPAQAWIGKPDDVQISALAVQRPWLERGFENNDSLRDWNEEIQNTRELPVTSLTERVSRARLLHKTLFDYSLAAIEGAELLVKGELSALNPGENAAAQMYIYSNIFFSQGLDGVGTFHREGGDFAAHKAVALDVNGVRTISAVDVDGLSVLGTCIVDIAGKRVVAQSIVPGIFKQRPEDESQIVYGGVDGRDVVATDAGCEALFAKAASALHLRRHAVFETKDDVRKELELSIETKGLAGADGRFYVLDLYTLTPVDIRFLESECIERNETEYDLTAGETAHFGTDKYPHRFVNFRQEFVQGYWELKLNEYVRDKIREDQQEEPTNDTEEKRKVDLSGFNLSFNPDTFLLRVPTDESSVDKAARERDEILVREMSAHLWEAVIPQFVADVSDSRLQCPIDGESLCKLLHRRGINLRYLGAVAELAEKKGASISKARTLLSIAQRSIISRAVKHVLRQAARDVPYGLMSDLYAHLLNGVFNSATTAHAADSLERLYQTKVAAFRWLHEEFVIRIRSTAKQLYRYDLPQDWAEEQRGLPLLREICLQLGIKIQARAYFTSQPNNTSEQEVVGPLVQTRTKKGKAFKESSAPKATSKLRTGMFEAADILDIIPRVKESSPRSGIAEEALEVGRLHIAEGQKDLGIELVRESISLHEQIYGVLHPETARAYNQAAMIWSNLDQPALALDFAQKAVIVSERTVGLDNTETTLYYLNLALFEHAEGQTLQALAHIQHALTQWRLVYGVAHEHPDLLTTLNNVAVMLQSIKEYEASLAWFERARELCVSLYGDSSIHCASIYFQLAQALTLVGDHNRSVKRMRDAYQIFLKERGADDTTTKEAESWLSQLTSNAVAVGRLQRQSTHLTGRLGGTAGRQALQPTPGQALNGTHPGPGPAAAAADKGLSDGSASIGSRGDMAVDDLVAYINGSASATENSQTSKAGKKKANKRRA
ncbi:Intracellular distribution of mitochondria [Savitreella phatthalungensis]